MYDNSKAICIVHPYLFASPVSEPRSDTRQSIPCWWRFVGCTLTASACYVRSSRTSARSRHCCWWRHTGYRYGCRTTASQLERQRTVGSHFGQLTIAQIVCLSKLPLASLLCPQRHSKVCFELLKTFGVTLQRPCSAGLSASPKSDSPCSNLTIVCSVPS